MKNCNLSKDMLLSYISPIDITLKALNLNEFPTKNISSPFTEDKNPSFQVFKNGSFKCYSTGKSGDCFNLIAELNGLNCKNDFKEILSIVVAENNLLLQHTKLFRNKNTISKAKAHIKEATQFSEYKTEDKQLDGILKGLWDRNGYNRGSIESNVATKTKPFTFKEIVKVDLDKRHLDFWLQLGVKKSILNKYKVFAIKSYSFFSERKRKNFSFTLNNNEIGFCYEVNNRFEIYIPKQKTKQKTFLNALISNDIYGVQQIENKVENIIICAGKKDALTLIGNGFFAVSFRSENQFPCNEQIDMLKQKCNHLFICYDNDEAGKNAVNRIVNKYPAISILQLPKTINDIADFYVSEGKKAFTNFFKENTNGRVK